ncbi:PREDICTED: uncharacterized protein LOC104737877 [Camelina sativa]|uniref:Uncharacterized protein LOC104737877 n=1 Tax=Camelina sativa TaxID=90675 RepID=A0ABM0VHZ0_CAMSA|nr:PREDICTED: uncharacterized protein LOC104737877 [Camelina sativa]
MDSDEFMNPYLPSSSYMNLLHSQLDNHNLKYTPLDSPCSETPSEPSSEPPFPKENRKSRHAWLPTDDIMLVSAWLNTSKDRITSNEQRRGAFWGRIADYFASCPNAVGRSKREASHCRQEASTPKVTLTVFVQAHRVCHYRVCTTDAVDEYLRLSETMALSCLENFKDLVITLFGDEYLRRPTPVDLQRLLDIGEFRGFPGMIGSIDCTLNDINILDPSPVFDDILHGRAPKVKYSVNGHEYKLAYYLTDGTYPK